MKHSARGVAVDHEYLDYKRELKYFDEDSKPTISRNQEMCVIVDEPISKFWAKDSLRSLWIDHILKFIHALLIPLRSKGLFVFPNAPNH